jgi:hypothetical protein
MFQFIRCVMICNKLLLIRFAFTVESFLVIIIHATIHCFKWPDLIKLWDEWDGRLYDYLESAGYKFAVDTDPNGLIVKSE